MLPSDIAYLALDHFENDAGVKKLESVLPSIMKAKGLILDIRANGGGSSVQGAAVLSFLSTKPVPYAYSTERQESNLMRTQGDLILLDTQTLYQRTQGGLHWPCSCTGWRKKSFSAAEDFLLSYITCNVASS